jgi:PDZ domain-containing protein
MRPGPAFNTLGEFDHQPMFTFGKDVKTYPTKGSLDFTTVSVTRAQANVSLAEAFGAYFDDDTAVVPRSFIYREGESADDAKKQGQAQLSSSKDSSRVAGLRAAGYTVPEVPTIDSVDANGSAKGQLRAGDVIRSVDGRDTSTAKAVVEAVGRVDVGDPVTIGYSRHGAKKDVTIVTRPDAKDERLPRIGVKLRSKFDFPIKITNNVGEQVGGPSAGTMFALAIYDRLTPGPLTGGLVVAGTGEIAPDGTVGPIGGIRQKIAGAADDDATVFLVPAANCKEAVDGGDHGLRLVRISTLKSAIDALESLAKDRQASVPRCR